MRTGPRTGPSPMHWPGDPAVGPGDPKKRQGQAGSGGGRHGHGSQLATRNWTPQVLVHVSPFFSAFWAPIFDPQYGFPLSVIQRNLLSDKVAPMLDRPCPGLGQAVRSPLGSVSKQVLDLKKYGSFPLWFPDKPTPTRAQDREPPNDRFSTLGFPSNRPECASTKSLFRINNIVREILSRSTEGSRQ